VAIKLAKAQRFERVYAADISRGMLDKARANALEQGCTIETVETDMVELPFEEGSLDLVVGCAVLHHLPDPAAFLREVRRVLKPGAPCVFIGDPSTWGNRLVETLKLPLVTVGHAYKKLAGKQRDSWEYKHIDVHTFSVRDIQAMTEGFERVHLVSEGAVEPLIDGSLLTPVREVLGGVPGVSVVAGSLRSTLRWLDRALFDRIVPRDLCGNLKFSARKPLRQAATEPRPARKPALVEGLRRA
jgi:SAM-dependent methyltransferase